MRVPLCRGLDRSPRSMSESAFTASHSRSAATRFTLPPHLVTRVALRVGAPGVARFLATAPDAGSAHRCPPMNTSVSASIAPPRPARLQATPLVSASPNPLLLPFVFVGLLGLVPMVAHAQTTTMTASTTTEEDFESPPKCEVIGSTPQEISTSQQVQAGAACIGIGNRDVPNGSPACGGLARRRARPLLRLDPSRRRRGGEHQHQHPHADAHLCAADAGCRCRG